MTVRTRQLQSSLAAGEVSEDLHARSDLEAYFEGVAELKNFLPQLTGGAVKRGGMEFIGDAVDHTRKQRLLPFIRGRSTSYVLELRPLNLRIRARSNGAYLLNSSSAVIDLTTPWDEADLAGLTYFQSGDVMYFGHLDRETNWKVLKRFSEDNWSLDDFSWRDGPWLKENTSAIQLTPSATFGVVTLSSSLPYFNDNHVGALFYLKNDAVSMDVNLWQENTAYLSNQLVTYGGRVYSAFGAGTSGYYPPIHDSGKATDGGVEWVYVHDGLGVVQVTAFADSTRVTATVLRTLPSSTATGFWAEGAVSAFRGYPALGVIHEERFWAMSTVSEPDTAYAGRSFDYDPDGAGFKPETAFGVVSDDDGFSATVADGEVNDIIAAVSADWLYVLTEANVKRISGPSQDEPITAGGRVAREVSSVGAKKGARPVKADDALIYVSADGKGLRELPYARERRRDLMVMARHVAGPGVEELHAALYPDQRLFLRRSDGKVYTLLYSRSDGVVAFSPLELGGAFDGAHAEVESICVIPGDSGRDEVWFAVKRTVNGATRRTVERLRRPWDRDLDRADEQFYLDSCVLLDHWNADTAKTVTLTLDNAAKVQPGDTGVLTASGHAPFTVGDVGKEYWARKTNAPARATDEPGPLRVKVTSYTSSAQVSVELVATAPAALTGVALYEWALPTNQVTGLTHLEGESVMVLADGVARGPFVVSGGAVTMPVVGARKIAGLAWSARVVSLPLELGSEIGSGRGALAEIESVTMLLKDAIGGQVGPKDGPLEAVVGRTTSNVLGRAPEPRRETVRAPVEAGFDEEGQLEFLHSDPTAVTVLGIAAEVLVNG